MKKNYLEPTIQVRYVMFQNMMANSMFIDDTPTTDDAPVKEDFENFFD